MDKEVGVSLELLQKVVDYLQNRPFQEVHTLITELLKEVNKDK